MKHLNRAKLTVNFIQNTPSLFRIKLPQDRTTKITKYLAEIIVNGNSDVKFKDDIESL
jgi:pyruvate carboxylase